MSTSQTVVIREFPLDLYTRARLRNESLMREFAFIAEGGARDDDTPRRLLELVDALRVPYAGFSEAIQEEIEAALERGDYAIDLEMDVLAGAPPTPWPEWSAG